MIHHPHINPGRIDIKPYFKRIGFVGDHSPDLSTLSRIVQCHTHAIPFENLSSFSGEAVQLDIDSLAKKLIVDKRGGYCFEHNTLLWSALCQLGFEVQAFAARVRWNQPSDLTTPISHMLLQVTIGNKSYLVDVGFGGVTLTAPIDLSLESAQETTHETVKIVPLGHEVLLQVELNELSQDVYTFERRPFLPQDYVAWNWFVSTSPQSIFTNSLMLCKPDEGGRHVLNGSVYKYYGKNGEFTSHQLSKVEDLKDCFRNKFKIENFDTPALEGKLAALLQNGG